MAFWLIFVFWCTCVGIRMSTNQIVGTVDPMTIRGIVIIFRLTHKAGGGCSERFKLSDLSSDTKRKWRTFFEGESFIRNRRYVFFKLIIEKLKDLCKADLHRSPRKNKQEWLDWKWFSPYPSNQIDKRMVLWLFKGFWVSLIPAGKS